jgi:antitoxin (DNA-binding transcriptional repressor) of toxin-antitoxin stability system
MKQISLREFQLHASKYISALPIVLTQYNKPIAIVSTHFEKVSTEKPTVSKPVNIEKRLLERGELNPDNYV